MALITEAKQYSRLYLQEKDRVSHSYLQMRQGELRLKKQKARQGKAKITVLDSHRSTHAVENLLRYHNYTVNRNKTHQNVF